MFRSLYRYLVFITLVIPGIAISQQPIQATGLIDKYCAIWDQPPSRVPADHSVDSPLMGNGDIGVTFGGSPEHLCFYLSKNDFWRLQSKAKQSGPRIFGTIDVEIENLKDADYHLSQQIVDGTVIATFKKDKLEIQIKAWVAATDNLLVIQFMNKGVSADVQILLKSAKSDKSESLEGIDDSISWAQREFKKDVEKVTEAAAAMKLIGANANHFTLSPAKSVTLITAIASYPKHENPLEYVKKQIDGIDFKEIQQIRTSHKQWWANYWEKSWVKIGDSILEKSYYQSLYTMAASSRDPDFPPGIFGIWITTDNPRWSGDYHLNYNHMAPFYALYSANRIEQALPQDGPLLAFRDRGQWYAKNLTGTSGVLYPVGIGPLGIETTRFHVQYENSPNYEKDGLFFQQRSNAAYCLVNIAQCWRCTYNHDYGKKVYPLVKDVADFWVDYLKFEDGRYVIYGDAIHEGSGQDSNPILSLGLLRNSLDLAIDISRELGFDNEKRKKWQYILDNLSGFSTQIKNNKAVFRYTEKGTAWWINNTLGIQHIYPGNNIGLDSDPELLKISQNTIEAMQRWKDYNGTNSFFPAAVRVGYNPEIILEKLRDYAQNTYLNGFQKGNPHGIENCSTVPNTINMMLCMSHVPVGGAFLQGQPKSQNLSRSESVIRLFPVWPRNINAQFENIRCWGAFLVSSLLVDQKIQYVKLYSEAGRECTMVNPWPEKKVDVFRDGQRYQTLQGEKFSFKTNINDNLLLAPTDITYEQLQDIIKKGMIDD
ncbi:MAG: hypothetical protein JEZ07_01115 [Phycisphaerae bacterium]|nr:hypothetical protein [Phycisphaerae bacterium]